MNRVHSGSELEIHQDDFQDEFLTLLRSVNLIVENSGGTAAVPWREKRGDSGRAWMYLNMMDFTSELHWDQNYNLENITFSLKTNFDNPGHYSSLYFDLLNQPDLVTGMGPKLNTPPVLGDANFAYFIDSGSGGDVYVTLQATAGEDWGKTEVRNFEMKKCFWPECQVPTSGDPNPPHVDDVTVCNWSNAACWPGNYVPGTDPANRENITIVIDRHVMLDVANVYLDDLYIEGTLELDQSAADHFVIEVNNILVNTGHGGVENFVDHQTTLNEGLRRKRKRV